MGRVQILSNEKDSNNSSDGWDIVWEDGNSFQFPLLCSSVELLQSYFLVIFNKCWSEIYFMNKKLGIKNH